MLRQSLGLSAAVRLHLLQIVLMLGDHCEHFVQLIAVNFDLRFSYNVTGQLGELSLSVLLFITVIWEEDKCIQNASVYVMMRVHFRY